MNSYTIKRPCSFDLDQIFDCGQSFRFIKHPTDEDTYHGVAFSRYIKVKQDESNITIYGCDENEYNKIWQRYFSLDLDYSDLRNQIKKIRPDDLVLADAMQYGRGIRFLRQEKWETLCSFIISQNNNIPRIRSLIEAISQKYGDKIETYDVTLYAFPSAEKIASVTEDELRELKVGFRAPYILDAARKVASGELNLDELDKLPTNELIDALMKVKGVGLKVASCVALFAYSRLDSFPIDVWVKKVLNKYYPEGFDHLSLKNTAGLVQQYLFYYERYKSSNI